MAGEGEGWARLARSLRAELDEARIEAYRGTVSLPFEAGPDQQGGGEDGGRPGHRVACASSRSTDAEGHRPPDPQLALRGADAPLELRPRERSASCSREGRRPAGYVARHAGPSTPSTTRASSSSCRLVNQIRERVAAWRAAGYPGVTGTTKRLLEHWSDPERSRPALLLLPARGDRDARSGWPRRPPPSARGSSSPGDGGAFARLCVKMATGTGKTVVMAMVDRLARAEQGRRPAGRALREARLRGGAGPHREEPAPGAEPSAEGNYYDEFDVVPSALRERLRQGRVLVRNWHALGVGERRAARARSARWTSAARRATRPTCARCWASWRRARNLLVINDEAHHAWRVPPGEKPAGVAKAELEEATKWIGGLDRIHRARGILAAYDFSATPFVPSGKKQPEEALFGWIVERLRALRRDRVRAREDAARRGARRRACPTPRATARSSTTSTRTSRDDLNRKAEPHEPLPRARDECLLPARARLARGGEGVDRKRARRRRR